VTGEGAILYRVEWSWEQGGARAFGAGSVLLEAVEHGLRMVERRVALLGERPGVGEEWWTVSVIFTPDATHPGERRVFTGEARLLYEAVSAAMHTLANHLRHLEAP